MWNPLKRLLALLGLDDGSREEPSPGGVESRARGEAGGESPTPEPLTCPEALERLFEYLDGELDDPTAGRVQEHLEVCRRCYPRLQFETAFMETLRRAREGKAAPLELRSRVVDLLKEEGLVGS